jgi:hypothetical protein
MITLNNKKFAKTENEFINSLFNTGGTCVGYYKPLKKRIKLLDPNKKEIGSINAYGVLGACTLVEGKKWYSYGTPSIIGDYKSYIKENEEIEEALKLNNIKRQY